MSGFRFVAIAAGVCTLAAASGARAEIKTLDQTPAATLLLPYFEVDLNQPKSSATVTGDVDLYDQPGGEGSVIGMLRKGSHVSLAGCRDDRWCEVEKKGWVWGEFVGR